MQKVRKCNRGTRELDRNTNRSATTHAQEISIQITAPWRLQRTTILLCAKIDGVDYNKDVVFSVERLSTVTLEEIVAYFNYRAYGTATLSENDNPTLTRSTSLYYWKKAISYHMPNKHIPWNELSKMGNPTKSVQVNEMIQAVVKKEVRKLGKKSQARRPLKEHEFRDLINRLRQTEDIYSKYMILALLCFQFHMIGRIDDCSSWQQGNLQAHDAHADKCLKARLAWSKNVNEERDAPWQHVLGSMDPVFCVILNVALWFRSVPWYRNGCWPPTSCLCLF